MTRTEKIDLVRSGEYIIENDMMKGDLRVLDVLNSIQKKNVWVKGEENDDVYGIDKDRIFIYLWSHELNNRPRFKMSELVGICRHQYSKSLNQQYPRLCVLCKEVENTTLTPVEIVGEPIKLELVSTEVADNYQNLFNLISKEHGVTLTILEMDEIIIESAKISKPTEPKEFITRDELKRLWLNFTFTELATKINQMAFEAYKTK